MLQVDHCTLTRARAWVLAILLGALSVPGLGSAAPPPTTCALNGRYAVTATVVSDRTGQLAGQFTFDPATSCTAGAPGSVLVDVSVLFQGALSVPGYHLHVLTGDRRAGGHLLECQGCRLRIQIQRELDLRVSLPHSAEFLQADLSRDPTKDLDKAEH